MSLQTAIYRGRIGRQMRMSVKLVEPPQKEDDAATIIKGLNIRIRDLEDTIKRLRNARNEPMEEIELTARPYRRPALRTIIKAVSIHYEIDIEEIIGERRLAAATLARQVAMYLCKKLTLNSYPRIGKEFSGRDHTTIMHGYRKIAAMRMVDAKLDQTVNELIRELQNGAFHVFPDAPSGAVADPQPAQPATAPPLSEVIP